MNFLPGWFPFIGGITALSVVDSATSTAATITGPAGIVASDLLVLLDRAFDGSSQPTPAVPSGFTSIVDTNDGALTTQVASYKIADGSEASASLTGMNGSISNGKALYVFRGNGPIAAVTVSTPNEEGTGGNPASQNVAASGGTVPLIVIGCYGGATAVDPRTFTPAKDGEINPATTLYLAYKIYNASPQDTSIDMDDETGSNILQSFYLAVS